MKITGYKNPAADRSAIMDQTARKAAPIRPEKKLLDRPGSVSRLIILGHFNSFNPVEAEVRLNQVAGLRADYWGPQFLESMGISLCDLPYELHKDNPDLVLASFWLGKSQSFPSATVLAKLRTGYKYGGWIVTYQQDDCPSVDLKGKQDHLLYQYNNPIEWLLSEFLLP